MRLKDFWRISESKSDSEILSIFLLSLLLWQEEGKEKKGVRLKDFWKISEGHRDREQE